MRRQVLTALPVYNEAAHVVPVLDEIRRKSADILVVDDGSTDHTPRLLGLQPDVRVIRHPVNRGYGAALKSAFDFALRHRYDVLVTIDCDGQHEPDLIPSIAARVFGSESDPVDIVSGSRYLRRFRKDNRAPPERRRINMAVTRLLNDQLGLRLTDAFCGFKAYRVESLRSLRITEPGYGMPLQLWIQAAVCGMRIVEFPVPLVYLPEERSFGGSLDDADRRMAYYREVIEREFRDSSNLLPASINARFASPSPTDFEAPASTRTAE